VQRGSRLFRLAIALMIVMVLIFLSVSGALAPVENILSVPIGFIQDGFGSITRGIGSFFDDLSEFRDLRRRNQDLEEALAVYQAENAQLREKGQDYDHLAALLEYDQQSPEDREYITCDVIGVDTAGFVRAVQIDCGRRDGVDLLDPVVSDQGLIGRVVRVSAVGAEVLLLPDADSHVNARIQRSREDGVISGQLSGDLLMSYLSVDADVREGDLVLTNGLGQLFPADIVIGRVMSVSLSENELYKEARVRSLIDFDRLEIVQVVINFEPVDLSVFQDDNQP
jgi:rod shape-determining protein MreC